LIKSAVASWVGALLLLAGVSSAQSPSPESPPPSKPVPAPAPAPKPLSIVTDSINLTGPLGRPYVPPVAPKSYIPPLNLPRVGQVGQIGPVGPVVRPLQIAKPVPLLTTEADLAKPHPDVVQGVLPNGLRYAIFQRPSHGRESIRLRILAGSRDEGENERGLAHYLEHMAFNGSRDFPAASLIKRFETAGVAFGRDQNAFTTYGYTTYHLDLPEADKAKMDLAFKWLGDVSHGLALDQAEVDRERGVVMSEYRLQLGPEFDIAHEAERFFAPDMLGPHRLPIGTEAGINGVDASALRRFYQIHYRPDRALLVAVGEIPVAEVQAQIQAAFANWRRSGPPWERPGHGQVDPNRPLSILTQTAPTAPKLDICRFSPRDPHRPESVATHERRLNDSLWTIILNRRLQALKRRPDPPFVGAGAGWGLAYDAVFDVCLNVTPLETDWRRSLAAVTEEARRFETYGPTANELRDARIEIIAGLNRAVQAQPTEDSDTVANALVANMTEENTFDTAEENRRVQVRALLRIDQASVRAAFQKHWTQAGQPVIVAQLRPAAQMAAVDAAWRAALAAPAPTAPVDTVYAPWAYTSFGPPGAVAKREVFQDPDFVRLTFANGVVVNFKETQFSKGQVDIRISLGAGEHELEPGKIFATRIAGSTLSEGAFGKNSAEDVTHLCESHVCSLGFNIFRNNFTLWGSGRGRDVGLELQILTAELADPGFRPDMDAALATQTRAMYRATAMSPLDVAELGILPALPPPPTFVLPSLDEALAYRHQDFAAILKPILTQAALEVTVVGDIDEAHVTPLLAQTVGALPPRPRVDRSIPGRARVHYPAKAPAPIIAYHDSSPDRAAVVMTWPLFAWTPARVREDRTLDLLALALQDAVIERVRQKLGKTYSPSVTSGTERGGDEGALTVRIESTPDAAPVVAAAVRALSLEFARGQITAEALERARKPLLDGEAKSKTYNAWWLDALDGTYTFPDRLNQDRTWRSDMTSITLEEVRAVARRWLAPDPIVVIALPCPGPGPCRKDLGSTEAAPAGKT
jgi:zinc protease